MDIFRTAYVYVRDTFAGELKETDEGLPMHETPYF
jgi:hypothetical protein